MKELSTLVNENYVSLHEAAEEFGISYSGFCGLLRRHDDIKEKYTFKTDHEGRLRTVITSDGLAILANLRNTNIPNTKVKSLNTFRNEKKIISEEVVRQAKPKTGIEALQQLQIVIAQQIEAYQKLEEQGVEIKEQRQTLQLHDNRITELEGDIEKMPITKSQKKRLHERVCVVAFSTNIHFSKVYTGMHEAIGPRSIDEYTFQDYGRAIAWLKQVFKKNNINW